VNLKTVEFVSIILTPLVLSSCLLVVLIYGRQAHRAIVRCRLADLDPSQCLIIGITVGFIGKLLDNSYWAIPWMCSFFDSPNADQWFRNGVLFNVPFRQTACIISAGFHILAATKVKSVGMSIIPMCVVITMLYLIAIYLLVVEIRPGFGI
jgi:hypothetical protein